MNQVRIIDQCRDAFADFSQYLATNLWGDITDEFSLDVLHYVIDLREKDFGWAPYSQFVPVPSIEIARDKRFQARLFNEFDVPTPETHVLPSLEGAKVLMQDRDDIEWILKYPTAFGGYGHELVDADTVEDIVSYEAPYLLQELIKMPVPEVYRTYCVEGDIFAWNVRRMKPGARSFIVVEPLGGRYHKLEGQIDPEARAASERALRATGLLASFGIVDLVPSDNGWKVLEIGTDGLYSYVDRDFYDDDLEQDLSERLAHAVWRGVSRKPWGKTWHPREG